MQATQTKIAGIQGAISAPSTHNRKFLHLRRYNERLEVSSGKMEAPTSPGEAKWTFWFSVVSHLRNLEEFQRIKESVPGVTGIVIINIPPRWT